MIKKIFLLVIPSLAIFYCSGQLLLKNQTRPVGYAMGENIELRFASNAVKNPPDSIQVIVVENKDNYRYELWAKRAGCDTLCEYSTLWDGRKPDGSWPSGGRYLVFAAFGDPARVFSDTVQIGLGD